MDQRVTRTDRLSVVSVIGVIVCGFLLLPGLHSGADEIEVAAATSTEQSPAPVEDGSTVDVSGRLIDEQGQPIAGADVWLSVEERWESSWEGPPVIAHATTDTDGRFTLSPLESVVNSFVESQATEFQTWAQLAGYQLSRHVSKGMIPDKPLEIQMQHAAPVAFRITTEDGAPAVSTGISVQAVDFETDIYSTIPDAIRKKMRGYTDANGEIRLDGFDRVQIVSLLMASEDHGLQSYFCFGRMLPTTLRMRSAGGIRGRLVLPAGSQADLSTVQVRIATLRSTAHGQEELWAGAAIVYPDQQGRFEIPAIAEGTIRVFVTEPDGFPYRSDTTPEGLIVSPGETSELVIPLRKAVRGTRLIREAKSKQPISGVRVLLENNHQQVSARTDANGQFTAFLLPGVLYNTVYDMPDGYLQQNINSRTRTQVPNGVQEHTLKPIDVLQSRIIEGIVRDANGAGFPGVRVGANWSESDEDFGFRAASGFSGRVWATTDASGHFRLTGVHPVTAISLTPVRAGLVLGSTVNVPGSEDNAVELSTEPFDFVSLNGRVVHQDGSPAAGVRYSIQSATDAAKKRESDVFLQRPN